MRIAIDGQLLNEEKIAVDGNFISEVFSRLAAQYPQHEFIFFTTKKNQLLAKMPGNVSYLKINPLPTNAILYKWWYDVKVPLSLKKAKADIFICPNGLCSLTASVPQVLVVQSLSFKDFPVLTSNFSLYFLKKFIAGFFKKSTSIAAVSYYAKNEIVKRYKVSPEKITVIGSGASYIFKAFLWHDREEFKEKYAQGCEYFIFNTIYNSSKSLVIMLKAFSIFKKWQKTNMKLVVVGVNHPDYKNEREKLNTYKYKNDVVATDLLARHELAEVVGGAYAAIFFESDFVAPVLETIQCEVPLIIAGNKALAEVAGETALIVNSNDPEEIAGQMKLIFKDEQLRSELIKRGKTRSKDFNWDKTTGIIWQLIEKAFSR